MDERRASGDQHRIGKLSGRLPYKKSENFRQSDLHRYFMDQLQKNGGGSRFVKFLMNIVVAYSASFTNNFDVVNFAVVVVDVHYSVNVNTIQ